MAGRDKKPRKRARAPKGSRSAPSPKSEALGAKEAAEGEAHHNDCGCASCGGEEAKGPCVTLGPVDLMGLELEFPLEWRGRIIIFSQAREALDEIKATLLTHGVPTSLARGNVSRNGTYVTYRLRLTFHNRKMMDDITKALAAIPGVKAVL